MDFLRNLLASNFGRYLQGIDFPISKQTAPLLRNSATTGSQCLYALRTRLHYKLPESVRRRAVHS